MPKENADTLSLADFHVESSVSKMDKPKVAKNLLVFRIVYNHLADEVESTVGIIFHERFRA